MYTIWSFFTHKRNFSYLVLIALAIAGVFSVVSIQKESNPEVKVPIGIVTTTLPGASATDVETLITNEIERALAGSLEQVEQITSVSREGVSSITVEFNADANLDKSIQDLKDEVDTVVPELPEEANDPFVTQIDFSQEPVLTFAVAGDLPPSEFTRLGLTLEDELETIPGVSSVTIAGLREREVQVVVQAETLRTYGISLTDVVNAIAQTNATLPVGSIEFDGVLYNLQFEAAINDPSEINDIALINANGQPIYVRDVAFVSDGLTETTSLSRVSVNGEPSQPALSFNVLKQTGGNVTDITTAVNERLAALQEPGKLLSEMQVLIIFDTGDLLIQDLTTLTTSGMVAALLVMGILFLTIGWRESLVAGLSIPLSFMIAFVGLLVSGNTLNFVSLFALILSVGILVDSAIVIVEGIHTNMKAWMDKTEAALKTIQDFHAPVTAGTMTTVAVFVPLFFISGIVGEFIKSIPFTVISVLLASLVVALGFIPLIASLLLRRRTTSTLEERQEEYTKYALNWYREKLSLILGHTKRENIFLSLVIALFFATPILPIKGIPAAIVFCVLVATVLYYFLQRKTRWYLLVPGVIVTLIISGALISLLPAVATMKVEFFPTGDEDYVIVEMELPEGTILDASEIESRKIEEILYTEPDIQSFVMTVGASSAFTGTGGSSGSKFANAFIELSEDREKTSLEVGDSLTEKFSAIHTSQVRVTQLAGGPPVGTPIVITFKGNDLDELEQLAIEAARILETIPGTNAVTTSTKDDNTEFVLRIDKAKATSLGLNPSLLAQTLRTAVQGSEATTINTPQQDIDVMVTLNLNPSYRDPHDTNTVTPTAIQQIEIQTLNGPILLGSVLDITVRKGSTAIRHENERRIATAQSELAEGGNVAEINRLFSERAATELHIPPGVEMIVGGENEETDQSFAEMGYAIIAGLILMFSIIVLMFNSFRHAVYVIAPAFLSFIGIALGLTLSGNALSFPSLMGLIALIGIVVNNSIILIDVMNRIRKDHPEWDMQTTVLEGASSRLRPILLTTLTTVIGIVPLLFASSLWMPLALSIIFGLSFAVIITLVMIPIIYHRNPGTVE
jgi:multidrug efflux pump subunit AcrB